jgi:hypothetical protein
VTRSRVLAVLLVLAIASGACRSRSEAPSPAPSTSASATNATGEGRLVLRSVPAASLKPGEVAILVENSGDAPVEIESELVVERMGDGGWEEIFTSGLMVRADCNAPVSTCLTMGAHTTVKPPPWLGMEGDAQCGCKDCATARPGRYRFVARKCDRSAQIEGEPFDYAR